MRIVIAALLITTLTGCAGAVMGDDWQAANADAKAAQAAAEWAHTHQVEAETAAAASEAPAREQARTVALVAMFAVGVLVALGCGTALVVWSWQRARLVFADKFGLYPVVIGAAAATNLNEPGAQHARIAPGRSPVQVLPAPEIDPIELIPEPVIIDGRRLEHIERLLLAAPAGSNHDSTD